MNHYTNEENEFLASFSQSVNLEECDSCSCSSNCIRNEIKILKNQVERMEEKLDTIIQKLDNKIIKNCDKMGDHIDFVNNVYDTVKVPLHYISNKVQKMIGNSTKHADVRISNKIEDSKPVHDANDDEYFFTENE
jgi:hypothetical protein